MQLKGCDFWDFEGANMQPPGVYVVWGFFDFIAEFLWYFNAIDSR
jgi:hypothetical protein